MKLDYGSAIQPTIIDICTECRPATVKNSVNGYVMQTVIPQARSRSPKENNSPWQNSGHYLQESFRWLLVFGFGILAAYSTYDGLYQLISGNAPDGKINS